MTQRYVALKSFVATAMLAVTFTAAAQQSQPKQVTPPPPAAAPTPAVNPEPAPAQASLMSRAYAHDVARQELSVDRPHAMRAVSLFAIEQPEPRLFERHDLIQIIVREVSKAESSHNLKAEKTADLGAKVNAWPHFNLADLLQLQLEAGNGKGLPEIDVEASKKFKGKGDYDREDEFTARLTAEVIEIMPNGNLVLEARTYIKQDNEESTMRVTGVCRPEDVSPVNTVLSNQIHDLHVEKVSTGDLKSVNEKGIIAKVFDAVFAW